MKKSFLSLLVFIISISYALAFENTAIVIVDMQDKFFERSSNEDTEEVKALVENNKKLLKWGVKNNLPVLIFEYDGYGPTTDTLLDVYKNHEHKTVIKYRDGGFSEFSVSGDLSSREIALDFLKEKDVNHLIFMGINGPYCVKSTVKGALSQNFEIYTAGDIVADVNPHPPTFPDTDWWLKDEDSLHTYTNYVEIIEFFEEKHSIQNNTTLAVADSNN